MSSEENADEVSNEVFWRNLAVRYWYLVIIFGLIIVGTVIGFITTLEWYIETSEIGGYGSWTFDQFSLGTAIEWVLYLLLWMILRVVLPALAVAGIVAAITWFVALPTGLRKEIRARSRTPKTGTSGGSEAFGFLLFIGLCIYVFIDGNWLTEFGDLTYGYFVNAWITVLIWALFLFGIPAAVLGTMWFLGIFGKSDSAAPPKEAKNKDT